MYDIWHFHMVSYKYLFNSHAIRIPCIIIAKSHFVGHVVYFAHRVPLLSCSTFLASYVMSGLWTNQMWSCLKKMLVVHNQTHVFISHHSSLLRNQQGCQHVISATFVESISRGLSPTFLKILHVNLVSWCQCSSNSGTEHPKWQQPCEHQPAMCCKGLLAVAWI